MPDPGDLGVGILDSHDDTCDARPRGWRRRRARCVRCGSTVRASRRAWLPAMPRRPRRWRRPRRGRPPGSEVAPSKLRPSAVRMTAPTHGFGAVMHRTSFAAAIARVMNSRSTGSPRRGGSDPGVPEVREEADDDMIGCHGTGPGVDRSNIHRPLSNRPAPTTRAPASTTPRRSGDDPIHRRSSTRWHGARRRSPPRASRPHRFGEPATLRSRASPRIPATFRDRRPRGLTARIASAKPGRGPVEDPLGRLGREIPGTEPGAAGGDDQTVEPVRHVRQRVGDLLDHVRHDPVLDHLDVLGPQPVDQPSTARSRPTVPAATPSDTVSTFAWYWYEPSDISSSGMRGRDSRRWSPVVIGRR